MAGKKKLGRGLSALLGDSEKDYAKLDQVRTAKPVSVELLHPGKYQPRHYVDQVAVEALADSIKDKGVLQPLLVRRHPDDPSAFEIIAGERRWRAAQLAKLHEVPVIIKDFDDQTTLEVALIENVQREDLSAIEEADAFQRLMDEFEHTQEDVAKLVGKSRSHVANTLRLLGLEENIKKLIDEGLLSAGHARTLIGVERAHEKAQKIISKGMSVREAEMLARDDVAKPKSSKSAKKPSKDVDTIALERDLSIDLGLKVTIDGQGTRGTLKVSYDSLDQLDDVIRRLRDVGHSTSSPDISEPKPIKSTDKPKLSVSLKPKSA